MFQNNNKLTSRQINVMMNLAESLIDCDYSRSDLTCTHPISEMYKSLSRGMTDISEEFEYSMIAELIENSILENDKNLTSRFIKDLSTMNDDMNLGINIGKLAKYIL